MPSSEQELMVAVLQIVRDECGTPRSWEALEPDLAAAWATTQRQLSALGRGARAGAWSLSRQRDL